MKHDTSQPSLSLSTVPGHVIETVLVPRTSSPIIPLTTNNTDFAILDPVTSTGRSEVDGSRVNERTVSGYGGGQKSGNSRQPDVEIVERRVIDGKIKKTTAAADSKRGAVGGLESQLLTRLKNAFTLAGGCRMKVIFYCFMSLLCIY